MSPFFTLTVDKASLTQPSAGSKSYCEIIIVMAVLWPEDNSAALLLSSSPHFSTFPLTLTKPQRGGVNILSRTAHPTIADFQHREQPRGSVFTVIPCREELPSLRLNIVFVYGHECEHFEGSLIPCQVS